MAGGDVERTDIIGNHHRQPDEEKQKNKERSRNADRGETMPMDNYQPCGDAGADHTRSGAARRRRQKHTRRAGVTRRLVEEATDAK